MDMKYIRKKPHKLVNIKNIQQLFIFLYYKFYKRRGGGYMFKFLAKVAEKYAKSTNTSCVMIFVLHQPKMPASLVKKD